MTEIPVDEVHLPVSSRDLIHPFGVSKKSPDFIARSAPPKVRGTSSELKFERNTSQFHPKSSQFFVWFWRIPKIFWCIFWNISYKLYKQEFPDRYGFRQDSNHDGIIPSCWKWMHHCQKIKALLGRDFLKFDSRFCSSLHTIRQISTQKLCSMEYGVWMYTRLVGSICHQKS